MTVVTPERVLEVILELEDDFEIVCDIYSLSMHEPGMYPKCQGDPAVWVAWLPNCCEKAPKYRLMCDSCRKEFIRRVARGWMIICSVCHAENGGYCDFTPLKS